MVQRDDMIDELDAKARDEEYARRVLREVRYIESEKRESNIEGEQGVVDEVAAEMRETRATRAMVEENDERRPSITWLLLSGNILLLRSITKYYGQMVIIAALFLLSIIVMFWSLHLDMRYNNMVRDIQLLRERSIRLQEVRFSRSSHSSIIEEAERRGLNLSDPTTPATVIDGSW